MLPKENESYGALYVQMVRAMVRKECGHTFKMAFSYTDRQREALDALLELLKRDAKERTSISSTDLLAGYHRFCWSLVHSPDPKSQENWGNPIQRFIWLKALRQRGSFLQAKDVTPILAQLKYFCRLVTLYEGLSHGSGMNPQEGLLQSVSRRLAPV